MEKFSYKGKDYQVINELNSDGVFYIAAKEIVNAPEGNVSDSKWHFSQRSLGNLEYAHPELKEVITKALETSKYDFTVTDGARTAAQQNALYQQGRTKPGTKVTSLDGYNKKSNHQLRKDPVSGKEYGYAVDLYPIVDGKIRAEDGDYEKYKSAFLSVKDNILATAKKLGINIEWGGNWKNPFDPPHYELKK